MPKRPSKTKPKKTSATDKPLPDPLIGDNSGDSQAHQPVAEITPMPAESLPTTSALSTSAPPKHRGRPVTTFTPPAPEAKEMTLAPGAVEVAIGDVQPREAGDSRPIMPAHVVTMMESIVVLGLLENLVVSTKGRLLAGAHRLTALRFLMIADDAARAALFTKCMGYGEGAKLPDGVKDLVERVRTIDAATFQAANPEGLVKVLVVDVTDDADHALAVEVAETAIRKQYGKDQIVALFHRLILSPRYTCRPGRPAAGQESAYVALAAVVGLSVKHLKRIVNDGDGKKAAGKSALDLAVAALARTLGKLELAVVGLGKAERDKILGGATKTLQKLIGE
jgi:hypothetical protein